MSNYKHNNNNGCGLAPADHNTVEHHADYPTTTPSSTLTYLDTLRRDCEGETLNAITFIEEFQDFTEDCKWDQEDWEADRRAEICDNHNISYPKCNYLATP